MQSLGLNLMIQIDKVETNWENKKIIVENNSACDVFGNKIKGYTLRETKVPLVIVTHNGISLGLGEFNKNWREFCFRLKYFPKLFGATDGDCLRIYHDSYDKNDLIFFLKLVEEFLSEVFKCEFSLNRKEI